MASLIKHYFIIPESNSPERQLFPDEIYLIGRSPASNIFLSDSTVSREHARLDYSDNSFIIRDLESTNGIKVNGFAVSSKKLESLDTITIGRINFTFQIREVLSQDAKSQSRDDSRFLDKELNQIISEVDDTAIKNRLIAFKKLFDLKKRDMDDMAYGDELTGLYNRRYFDKALHMELKRARRYGRPLTLIMVDIDHFKQFNDTFGHSKGDSVLRTVGAILKENSRSSDIVCRYGGEEICIILPEQNREQGIQTAEKLRSVLADQAREIEGVEITASFGVATTGRDLQSVQELMAKSDKALYEAKKSGRNCTKAL